MKLLLSINTFRSFGYIEFSTQQAAKEAVEGMNGWVIFHVFYYM